MTDDQIEIARAFTECTAWRWMPRMLAGMAEEIEERRHGLMAIALLDDCIALRSALLPGCDR